MTAQREGEVRVEIEGSSTSSDGHTIAIGDQVRFSTAIDGFDVDAGSGTVTRIEDGSVWVGGVDSRVRQGMDARIAPTGDPGATPSTPARDPRLAELARGHAEARGGDAWDAIRTMRQRGYLQQEGSPRVELTIMIRRPDELRIQLFDRSGGMFGSAGMLIFASRGDSGWWHAIPLDSSQPEEHGELDPETVRGNALEGSRLDDPFAHWEREGYEVRLVGRETLEGRAVDRVEIDAPGLGSATYDFAADSHLLVQKRVRPAGGEEQLTTFSDYRPVQGLQIAHAARTGAGSGPVTHTTFTEITLNPVLPDDMVDNP